MVNTEIRHYILYSWRWRSSIQSAKTRSGADCGSDHELLIVKFRLKLKKVGKTTRLFKMKVKVGQSCLTLCDPMDSPGQNTGVGSRSLLQQIFPTQGLNPGLLRCRESLYSLSIGRLMFNRVDFMLSILTTKKKKYSFNDTIGKKKKFTTLLTFYILLSLF